MLALVDLTWLDTGETPAGPSVVTPARAGHPVGGVPQLRPEHGDRPAALAA